MWTKPWCRAWRRKMMIIPGRDRFLPQAIYRVPTLQPSRVHLFPNGSESQWGKLPRPGNARSGNRLPFFRLLSASPDLSWQFVPKYQCQLCASPRRFWQRHGSHTHCIFLGRKSTSFSQSKLRPNGSFFSFESCLIQVRSFASGTGLAWLCLM